MSTIPLDHDTSTDTVRGLSFDWDEAYVDPEVTAPALPVPANLIARELELPHLDLVPHRPGRLVCRAICLFRGHQIGRGGTRLCCG